MRLSEKRKELSDYYGVNHINALEQNIIQEERLEIITELADL